LIKVLERVTE